MLLLASGVVAIMPHVASSFSCLLLSCLGNHANPTTSPFGRAMIGIPRTGEQSGVISIYQVGSASPATIPMQLCVGPVSVERITGTTVLPTGGGTQLPSGTNPTI